MFDIHYLQECINFKIELRAKIWNFASWYRSPSYSKDIFDYFAGNLELNLDSVTANNSELILLLGDFNAQTSTRYNQIKTAYVGLKIGSVESSFGLKQLIHDSTHILSDSSSCIYLIFTSKPNVAMYSWVHSLHSDCHHHKLYVMLCAIRYIWAL